MLTNLYTGSTVLSNTSHCRGWEVRAVPGELHRHLVQATTSAQARREPCLPSGHLNCALDTEEGAGAGVELLGLGDQAEMQHTLGPGRAGRISLLELT